MGKEVITFTVIDIEKHKFNRYENSIFLNEVGIDNILIFNRISSAEKNYK